MRALRSGPVEAPDKGANGPRRGHNKYRKKGEKENAALSEGSPQEDPHRLVQVDLGRILGLFLLPKNVVRNVVVFYENRVPNFIIF